MDLKDILNRKNSSLSAEIAAMDKTPMTDKNGYLSDIHFLTLHLANGDDMRLILKTPLKSVENEANNVYLTLSQAVNGSELNFYEKVYPELEKSIRELHLPNPLPKCYYAGTTGDGPVVVLDDLTQRDLRMPSLQNELSESQLRMILRSLAIVQVGSCGLQLRRKASLLEMFPFLKNAFNNMLQNLVRHQLETFKRHLTEQFPGSEKLFDLLSSICLDDGLNEFFFAGKDTDDFLSHGDLWNYNVFLNDKECLLIDWQGVSAGCPNGDIATLVLSSNDLGPEPSDRFESLVRCYLDFMLECCGDNAELKAHVEQKVVPFLSSAKMIRLSLQFGVKWIVASFDCFLDSTSEVRKRVIGNIYNVLLEMSH